MTSQTVRIFVIASEAKETLSQQRDCFVADVYRDHTKTQYKGITRNF